MVVTQGAPPVVELLEALYRRRFHSFVRVAEAICRDPHAAVDAVQEAFASAIRGRVAFRGDATIETWVWRCVVNAARDVASADVRRLEPADAVAEVAATNGEPPDEDVRAALTTLTERQREIVFLRYYADLDYRAIGEVLGISIGTVGAALHAAQASLRRRLEVIR
jgi:RNA polymerase sigma factor (sigma-70 family)